MIAWLGVENSDHVILLIIVAWFALAVGMGKWLRHRRRTDTRPVTLHDQDQEVEG